MAALTPSYLPLKISKFKKNFLPQLQNWFQQEHVKAVWPLKHGSVAEIEERYLAGQNSFIISTQEEIPFAFLNTYQVESHRDWWPHEPSGTIGFDYFIGDPNYLNKRLAIPMVQEILNHIFKHLGAKKIICDPPMNNQISQHVVKRAGMQHYRNIKSPDGPCALFAICKFPYLESQNLIIRLATADDAQSLLELHLENDFDHFRPWRPTLPYQAHTKEFWMRKIANSLQEFIQGKSVHFIFHRKEDSRIMGCLNFGNFERGAFQNCRLGYKTHKDFAGKGLTSEALEVAIKYLFETLHFHRIEANFIPSNQASKRVLEKLGFEFAGISKRYLKINGQWQDHVLGYKNTHLPDSIFEGC